MASSEDEDDASLHLSEVESIDVLDANVTDSNDTSTEDLTSRRSTTEQRVMVILKLSVFTLLIIAGVALSVATHVVILKQQNDDFISAYEGYASKIGSAFHEHSALHLWTAQSIASAFTAEFRGSQEWPFVTLSDFSQRTVAASYITKTTLIAYAPLVTQENRARWEQYAAENQHLLKDNTTTTTTTTLESAVTATAEEEQGTDLSPFAKQYCGVDYEPLAVEAGISVAKGPCESTLVNGTGPFLPMWQTVPFYKDRTNIDSNSLPFLKDQLSALVDKKRPSFSRITDPQNTKIPVSSVLFPVLNDFSKNSEVVGTVLMFFDWTTFFSNILPPNAFGLYAVLSNSCGQSATFELNGPEVVFLGHGDSHEEEYDKHEMSCDFGHHHSDKFTGDIPTFAQSDVYPPEAHLEEDTDDGACVYSLSIYPSDHLRSTFRTNEPAVYTSVVALIFVFTILLFLTYFYLAERRQQALHKTAARSNAIIDALFPAVVRDRVIRDSHNNDHPPSLNNGSGRHLWGLSRLRSNSEHTIKSGTVAPADPSCAMQSLSSSLVESREEDLASKRALLPILPETPKVRLKSYLVDTPAAALYEFDSEPIAEMFTDTTIMFADIAGFTAWASEREPSQVFILLETLYRAFDAVASRLRVFKVETIGDCYVAVTGLPDPNEHHAVVMTYFAYECIRQMKELTRELEASLGPGTSDLTLRVGLHSGPVTAGVLRGEKSRFQLFGDSVNTAARMESTGDQNLIHASQETADLLVTSGKVNWVSAREDVVIVKGKGEMQTFWLKPRRGSSRGSQSYVMDSSSCASTTIDSRPKHARVMAGFMHHNLKALPAASNKSATSKATNTSILPNDEVDCKRWGNLSLDETLTSKASVSSQKRAIQKRARLVDWNVDLLLSFLAKVVANRNDPTAIKRRPANLDNVPPSNSLILDEVTEIIILPDFDDEKRISNQADVILPPEVREQLHDFVTRIACMYRDNPFHNLEHASHVTMSAVKLMRRIINPDDIDVDPKDLPSEVAMDGSDATTAPSEQSAQLLDTAFFRNLHDSTFGISSDPLTQFCVVFSALIHVSISCSAAKQFMFLVCSNHVSILLHSGR